MNLNDLNPQQRKAVELVGGPILIFAGAGSGKTRVLTHKIAYLVQEAGLPAEHILAVTFTNKAANEMKHRVSELLQMDISTMSVGTFHSISAKILRREIHQLGYSNNFVIYDTDDSRAMIKKVIRDLNLDEKTFVPKGVQAQISKAKNQLISPQLCADTAEGFRDEKTAEIYMQYQEDLQKSNALDFDDLLLKPLQLFKEHPHRLEFYQNQFQYVLVDEYQDTNRPQFEFVYTLSQGHRDICVVGDDDQSIYSWRGADVNNILNFEEAFGDASIIKLEQNYRSTKTILECAWSVVSRNSSRAEKKLWTDNDEGEKVSILDCVDERDEGWQILKSIRHESHKRDKSFSDMVILYRTNAQSRVVEDALRREGIPYQIIGGRKFYDRKEIKDVLAYLRLIMNPSDSVSFDRIVNFPPRGIGKTTLEKIHSVAGNNKMTYLAVLDEMERLSVGPKQQKALHEFNQLIHKFKSAYQKENIISITTDLLLDIDLKSYFMNQNTQEALERWANVEELVNSIADFTENRDAAGLSDFLEEVSLLTDIDRWNESDEAVTLMTIHSAKGLEFPVVMVAGLEEGLFPLGNSLYEKEEMEEERRLFYVALTRAEKKAYLSFAHARRRFGGAPMPAAPSRFLSELPDELIEENTGKPSYAPVNITRNVPAAVSKPGELITTGKEVEHKIFGKGRVIAVDGVGDTAKLTVVFSGNVRKKLIAKYANLKPVKKAISH
ncbi:MAG: UvrD-helicase domain-containing protein [Candidatus Marinimicrobia bacterium]|nr:UvrD-helicase domain-containing protein [Candidatus Neomarinimicrobiota bacterium]